ncbi:MAG: TetR/AcrR family transcriptional regulator [Coprobacillus sp.]
MAKKYQNHYQTQMDLILDKTQELCIEKGIENVSIVNIAESCHITRATIYNYFHDKEDILWSIFFRHQSHMYERYMLVYNQSHTTYERLKSYAYTILELYNENVYYPVFMEIFGSIYMQASYKENYTSDNPYNKHGVKPGDIVALITKNFHDGSVKSELDPKLATVSFVYGVSSLIDFLFKSKEAVEKKYSLNFEDIAKTQLEWLLNEIKA